MLLNLTGEMYAGLVWRIVRSASMIIVVRCVRKGLPRWSIFMVTSVRSVLKTVSNVQILLSATRAKNRQKSTNLGSVRKSMSVGGVFSSARENANHALP